MIRVKITMLTQCDNAFQINRHRSEMYAVHRSPISTEIIIMIGERQVIRHKWTVTMNIYRTANDFGEMNMSLHHLHSRPHVLCVLFIVYCCSLCSRNMIWRRIVVRWSETWSPRTNMLIIKWQNMCLIYSGCITEITLDDINSKRGNDSFLHLRAAIVEE